MLAGKPYDADRIGTLIEEQGATPNIPAKSKRKWKLCFSKRLYRECGLIERIFSRLKHFRRFATRYDSSPPTSLPCRARLNAAVASRS